MRMTTAARTEPGTKARPGPAPVHGGPVSVTQLGAQAAGILAAVRSGQTIPVSRHGVVVAVLAPLASVAEAVAIGLDPDDQTATVGAREFGHGNASAVVDRAARGERVVVTYRNRPTASIGPARGWRTLLREPTDLGMPVPADSLAAGEPRWEWPVAGLELAPGVVLTRASEVDQPLVIFAAGRRTLAQGRVLVAQPANDRSPAPLPVPVSAGDTVVFPKTAGEELEIDGIRFCRVPTAAVLAVLKATPLPTADQDS